MARRLDPGNRLLWRARVRRLTADQIRDALLAVSGELQHATGGPSVDPSTARRTIFTKVIRNRRDELLAAFDGPDGFGSTPQRMVTTTPTQSLLMINGDWPLKRAAALAQRLGKERHPNNAALVGRAYRLVLGREPTAPERNLAVTFLSQPVQPVVPPPPAVEYRFCPRADSLFGENVKSLSLLSLGIKLFS